MPGPLERGHVEGVARPRRDRHPRRRRLAVRLIERDDDRDRAGSRIVEQQELTVARRQRAAAPVRPNTSLPAMDRSCVPLVYGVIYGKAVNRALRSVWLAASPSSGLTPKISSMVRSVELCV